MRRSCTRTLLSFVDYDIDIEAEAESEIQRGERDAIFALQPRLTLPLYYEPSNDEVDVEMDVLERGDGVLS